MPTYELTGWRSKSLRELAPHIRSLLEKIGPEVTRGSVWGIIGNWGLAPVLASQASQNIRFTSCYRRTASTLDWFENPSLDLLGDARLSNGNVGLSLTREHWMVPDIGHDGSPESRSIIRLEVRSLVNETPQTPSEDLVMLFREFMNLHQSAGTPMEFHTHVHPSFEDPTVAQVDYNLWIPVDQGLIALEWFARRRFTSEFDVNWEITGSAARLEATMKQLSGVDQIHPRFVSYAGTPPREPHPKYGVEPNSILYAIHNFELANMEGLAIAIDQHATSRDLLYIQFQPLRWPTPTGQTPAISDNSLAAHRSKGEWKVEVEIEEYPRERTGRKPPSTDLAKHLLPIVNGICETDLAEC